MEGYAETTQTKMDNKIILALEPENPICLDAAVGPCRLKVWPPDLLSKILEDFKLRHTEDPEKRERRMRIIRKRTHHRGRPHGIIECHDNIAMSNRGIPRGR